MEIVSDQVHFLQMGKFSLIESKIKMLKRSTIVLELSKCTQGFIKMSHEKSIVFLASPLSVNCGQQAHKSGISWSVICEQKIHIYVFFLNQLTDFLTV